MRKTLARKMAFFFSVLPGVILPVLSTGLKAGNIYRCMDTNGHPVFSQLPCGPEADEISRKIQRSSNFSAVTREGQDVDEGKESNTLEAIKKRNFEIKEKRLVEALNELEAEEKAAVALLKKKRINSADARERFHYNQQIDDITRDYQSRISELSRILEEHRMSR